MKEYNSYLESLMITIDNALANIEKLNAKQDDCHTLSAEATETEEVNS